MGFRVERSGPRVLTIFGEVDLAVAEAFQSSLISALGDAGDLLLDLSALEFIDSSGLRSLLSVAKRLGERGDTLVLVHVPTTVTRLLDIVGADQWPNVRIDP
jgi:anti-sigma B factor antagonist